MKPLHLAIMGILLSLVVWGSLFFTVLNQSAKTNELLKKDNILLSQQKQTLDSIQANARTRTQQLNSLQAHIDCLFNLATQPNRSSAYIANAQTCAISSAPQRVTSATPLPAPTQPKAQATNQTNNPAPRATPKPSLIKQLTNLLNL